MRRAVFPAMLIRLGSIKLAVERAVCGGNVVAVLGGASVHKGWSFTGGSMEGAWSRWETQSQGLDKFHIHLLRVVVVQVVDLPARHESSLWQAAPGLRCLTHWSTQTTWASCMPPVPRPAIAAPHLDAGAPATRRPAPQSRDRSHGQHQVTGASASGVDGNQALLANHSIVDEHATMGVSGCVGVQFDQGTHVVGCGLANGIFRVVAVVRHWKRPASVGVLL